jgi:hypothetical protein
MLGVSSPCLESSEETERARSPWDAHRVVRVEELGVSQSVLVAVDHEDFKWIGGVGSFLCVDCQEQIVLQPMDKCGVEAGLKFWRSR